MIFVNLESDKIKDTLKFTFLNLKSKTFSFKVKAI